MNSNVNKRLFLKELCAAVVASSFVSEDNTCLSESEGSDRCGPKIIPSDECFGPQDSCNSRNQDTVE